MTELQSQKPEFLKQFYHQARLTTTNLSETEVSSKREYINSRLDTKFWAKVEKNGSKRGKKKKVDYD